MNDQQPTPAPSGPENELRTCPYCDQPREDTFEYHFRFKCGTSMRRNDFTTVNQGSECRLRVAYAQLLVENTKLKYGTPQELAKSDPTPPAQDRHEASRAAFEARWPKYSIKRENGKYVHLPVHSSWEEWQAALDWQAAQEQPAPEPTQGSAREWVEKRLVQLYHSHGEECDALSDDEALELADRADAAERRLHDATSWWHPAMSALIDQQAAQLAAAQAEAGKLREVAESLAMAMETVRLDRTSEDDGNVWALQTLEWAEWLMEKATVARAALTPNNDEK